MTETNETARERVAEAIHAGSSGATPWADVHENDGWDVDEYRTGKIERREQADAVIAHLWDRAERPEVVEAVAKEMRDKRFQIRAWNDVAEGVKKVWRKDAHVAITATLTALIGPRPQGASDE